MLAKVEITKKDSHKEMTTVATLWMVCSLHGCNRLIKGNFHAFEKLSEEQIEKRVRNRQAYCNKEHELGARQGKKLWELSI